MNGNHRRSGMSQILSEATGIIAGLKTDIKNLRKLQPVAQDALDIILNSFTLCPDCEGQCGEDHGRNWWEDCDTCNGWGMLEIEKE